MQSDHIVCGVYKLTFSNSDFYIGCSVNIHSRIRDHISALKRGKHKNTKMQRVFNSYGDPTTSIIEECASTIIYEREFTYITELNALSSLNISIGGRGTLPEAEEILFYLTETTLTHKGIAEILEIPIDIVHNIAKGATHVWLQGIHPILYNKMIEQKGKHNGIHLTAESKGIHLPTLLSPGGETYKVSNIRGFSREHNLDYSSLNKLLHGKQKTTKGWRIL